MEKQRYFARRLDIDLYPARRERKLLILAGYGLTLLGLALGLSVLLDQARPLLLRFVPAPLVENDYLPLEVGSQEQVLILGHPATITDDQVSRRLGHDELEDRGVSIPPQFTRIPSRILISGLALDAEVVSVPFKNSTWDLWPLGMRIGYLEGTGSLGHGNLVLAGHISTHGEAGPFFQLKTLQPGDLITLYRGDYAYTYQVQEQKLVGPRDISVLNSTAEPTLTLISCDIWDPERGYYVARRVVTAQLIESSKVAE